MNQRSTSFNLDPDKLARLWNIGSDDNKPDENAIHSAGDKPIIPGYEVLDEIGRGGMGTVWKAVQLSTQRNVALKVMNSGVFGSKKLLSRFEREVEYSAKLNHPNIARVYDSGLERGQYYFAMEYLEGQHLDMYIQQNTPSIKEIMKLVLSICHGINHAHQAGIIHRDLKPSNILVTKDGQPHIVDFGVAKNIMEDAGNYTQSVEGELKGTYDYMSPEQVMGKIDQIGVRSDIYTLGVIMYRLLLGQPPYPIDFFSLEEVFRNIRLTEPQRPRKLVSHFDSDLEAILLKTLEKEAHRRYQSVAELIHDIECWLNGLPIVAKSSSSIYLLRKMVSKHRYASTILFLLLVILISSVLVSMYFYKNARTANLELQDIAQKWQTESAENLLLARRVLFMLFLQAWHSDNLQQAKAVSSWLSKDSKEAKGAAFLLNDKPVLQRLESLQKSLPKDQLWFADYMEAAYYLKANDRKKALEAFLKSSNGVKNAKNESWYASQIQAALNTLKVDRKPGTNAGTLDMENH